MLLLLWFLPSNLFADAQFGHTDRAHAVLTPTWELTEERRFPLLRTPHHLISVIPSAVGLALPSRWNMPVDRVGLPKRKIMGSPSVSPPSATS